MPNRSPIVLLILDGWGYCNKKEYNAILSAKTPQWDEWWQTKPHLLLEASGQPVGLPDGQMGNSEVGHLHIGAGRIIRQDFTRINDAIETGEFANNPVFLKTISEMKRRNQTLHIMGLLSDGGVHSHEKHLFAFLTLCETHQFSNLCLHLFLDGRDTPPQSAHASLKRLKPFLQKLPNAAIASISGRYYAMDRDKRWDRIESVYRLLTTGQSEHQYNTAEEAITTFYRQGIEDEFIPPTRIGQGQSIHDGDAVFFFNFRADRARQLTETLISEKFCAFHRENAPNLSSFISMTHYAKHLKTLAAFEPIQLKNTLGEVLARENLKQLRVAETEKYAHVTFFLNGGTEQAYPNEQRILIPSPQVSTYDLKPQMSAPELTKAIIQAIQDETYDVIISNFANADMVGHSGNFAAAVQAIEALDQSMKAIWQALSQVNGQLLITADHGNAEMMFDKTTQQAHTAHTNSPVPLLFVGSGWTFQQTTGTLTDVAPTLLTLLGIKPPQEMTGNALLIQIKSGNSQ